MPRPRTYVRADAVDAAKEAFWDNGYEATGVTDLEERTGLNRSSLYLAFGSKRALFGIALDAYMDDLIAPLLAPLEVGPPGLGAIATFLSNLQAFITEQQGPGRRGCLMVNTIAQLSSRDREAASLSLEFRDRLRQAFGRALEGAAAMGELDAASVPHRARMLAATVFGIWISARIDPFDAAALCEEIAVEVDRWRSAGAGKRASGPSH